jgi:hypothetical protein
MKIKLKDQAGGRDQDNNNMLGEISGSHGSEYDDDCLLGCCAV